MKKSELDRIIVDKNDKMTRIIRWWYDNKEWLQKEEFQAPLEAGLIVMEEEGLEIGFETMTNGMVRLAVYPLSVDEAAVSFDYDPYTTKVTNHKFGPKLKGKHQQMMKIIIEGDNTDMKSAVKYHALMLFAAHYVEIVEVDESKTVRRTKHEAKMLRTNPKQPLRLTKKTYMVTDFEDGTLHRFGEKRAYTKPDHEVQVRGFFRTSKSGKKTWVKPFSRYKDKGGKQRKDYKI